MPDGDGYLAAAYLVFLALVLIYVAVMAIRLGRLEKELSALADEVAPQPRDGERDREPTAA